MSRHRCVRRSAFEHPASVSRRTVSCFLRTGWSRNSRRGVVGRSEGFCCCQSDLSLSADLSSVSPLLLFMACPPPDPSVLGCVLQERQRRRSSGCSLPVSSGSVCSSAALLPGWSSSQRGEAGGGSSGCAVSHQSLSGTHTSSQDIRGDVAMEIEMRKPYSLSERQRKMFALLYY